LAMFFDRVSKFSRIINVSNINIRAKDKPEPHSTITAECVATTFVLLETAKPAAAAKAN
jgi:Tfp pilus assembly protein PilO